MNYSVIIPTYNRSGSIVRALDSVANQVCKPKEVIIIDDGSIDNTESVIADYQKKLQCNYVKFTKNSGVSFARNRGIEQAKTQWVALLDSDDAWAPGKMEKQIKALQKSPQHLLCHTNEIWIRNGVRVNPMKKHEKNGGWIYQRCLPLCAMSPSSTVINKKIFEKIGYFDESLPACEDYDLWLRITATHPVLYLSDQLTIKYGGHKDQLSTKYWGLDRYRIYSLEKMLNSKILNEFDDAATKEMLITKIKIYLKGAIKRQNKIDIIKYQKLLVKYTENESACII